MARNSRRLWKSTKATDHTINSLIFSLFSHAKELISCFLNSMFQAFLHLGVKKKVVGFSHKSIHSIRKANMLVNIQYACSVKHHSSKNKYKKLWLLVSVYFSWKSLTYALISSCRTIIRHTSVFVIRCRITIRM